MNVLPDSQQAGPSAAPGDAAATDVATLLASSGLPRSEALLLLAFASGAPRERLIAGSRDRLPSAVAERYDALARRRVAGEPIAYLLGRREFFGRSFAVDPRVLIPRPETEGLVDCVLAWLATRPSARRVLDLGTGSGAVAITLALERPGLAVVATDASDAALAVARDNAVRLGATVRVASGDWYGALEADDPGFAVIVSNPPYIAAGDRHLSEGDLRFEPDSALTDHGDGLAALRRIVHGAPARLEAGGLLAVEHGHEQAAQVRALMIAAGLVEVASLPDLAGIERITHGAKASAAAHDACL